ncbi:MAG: hypothetical protein AAF667_18610 [Pseudomonadota bacterium]
MGKRIIVLAAIAGALAACAQKATEPAQPDPVIAAPGVEENCDGIGGTGCRNTGFAFAPLR